MEAWRSYCAQNGGDGVIGGTPLLDELTPLLEQVSFQVLTRSECHAVLKGLKRFVAETPVEVIQNLFQEDQVTGVNCYNLSSPEGISHRNWQWVFHISFMTSGSEFSPSIQEMAWRKSKAVEMGRLMTFALGGCARLVIGYWIVKLYEARPLELQGLPECVKTACQGFLNWRGENWHSKKAHRDEMAPLSCRRTSDLSRKDAILSRWRSETNAEMDLKQKVDQYCNGVGSKRLIFYLSRAFQVSLPEFRNI